MGLLSVTRDNLRSMLRLVLLLGSLATYLVSPDDVVWRFIKGAPQVRLLEHFAFGSAAALLGVALFLKVQASTSGTVSSTRTTVGSLLQAVGIGVLLPLPGFLLFGLGNLGISLLLKERQPAILGQSPKSGIAPWTGALAVHIGLSCAVASMIIFSIVLVDRVADALFAMSALVSLVASTRRALQARPNHP